MMEKPSTAPDKGIFKLPGEPVVVINGVPPPKAQFNGTASTQLKTPTDAESRKNTGLGKAIEGRDVRKLFGEQYFLGKVERFDEDMNWYRVVYEDGDMEDLEWHELEEFIVPLDINIPLEQLATKAYKQDTSKSGSVDNSAKRGRGRPKGSKNKTKAVKTVAKSSAMKTASPEGVKSGRKRGRPRKTPGTESARQAITEKKTVSDSAADTAGTTPQVSASGRKRGRPRKLAAAESVAKETTTESNLVVERAIGEPERPLMTDNTFTDAISVDPNSLSGNQAQNPTQVISVEAIASSEPVHQIKTQIGSSETNVRFGIQTNVQTGDYPVEVCPTFGHQVQTDNSMMDSILFGSQNFSHGPSSSPLSGSIQVNASANSATGHQSQTGKTTGESFYGGAKTFPEFETQTQSKTTIGKSPNEVKFVPEQNSQHF